MYTPTAVAAIPKSVKLRKVVRTSGLRGVGSGKEEKDVEALVSVLACRIAGGGATARRFDIIGRVRLEDETQARHWRAKTGLAMAMKMDSEVVVVVWEEERQRNLISMKISTSHRSAGTSDASLLWLFPLDHNHGRPHPRGAYWLDTYCQQGDPNKCHTFN